MLRGLWHRYAWLKVFVSEALLASGPAEAIARHNRIDDARRWSAVGFTTSALCQAAPFMAGARLECFRRQRRAKSPFMGRTILGHLGIVANGRPARAALNFQFKIECAAVGLRQLQCVAPSLCCLRVASRSRARGSRLRGPQRCRLVPDDWYPIRPTL
jgi:hypothetical protein